MMYYLKYQFWIYSLLICVLLISCNKKEFNVDLKSSQWKVVKIKKIGDPIFRKAKENYILEFVNDTLCKINLDVNSCWGFFETINGNKISISDMGCTEACCDSDFAKDLRSLLPKMTDYYKKGNELILEGQGKIILKQYQ